MLVGSGGAWESRACAFNRQLTVAIDASADAEADTDSNENDGERASRYLE